MTIQQIIDRILAYHPQIPDYDLRPRGCDHFKCGDPSQECTGILISCAPSVDVIRKAAQLGYNLVLVHEPAFYTHLDPVDWLEGDEVYEAKAKIIADNNIVIWRDHDHIHKHQPDGIFYGMMKELGWEEYLIENGERKPEHYRLPETTVDAVARHLIDKMQLNGVRIIGDPNAKVSTVSFIGHIRDGENEMQKTLTQMVRDRGIDVVIPFETVDWSLASYIRDAAQLGMNKAMIQPGHINAEELGMKWAVNWVSELVESAIPVEFFPSADMYDFIVK